MAFKANFTQNSKKIGKIVALRFLSSRTILQNNVGFIGVGHMGRGMVNNLLLKGHNVKVYDISKSNCKKVAKKGAEVCKYLEEITEDVDFVISMLPTPEIVTKTYDRLVKNKSYGAGIMFIDSSTIGPCIAKEVADAIKSRGNSFLDAPVSGGVLSAELGNLTFMVGGSKTDIKNAKCVLEDMGEDIIHCGETGMGQAANLCNNMLWAISMIALSEASNLANRLGLDSKIFANALSVSTGQCWTSDFYHPVPGVCPDSPANNNYSGGFSLELMTKDLALASDVALSTETPILLGGVAHQFYRLVQTQGFGEKDFSFVYQFIKEKEKFVQK